MWLKAVDDKSSTYRKKKLNLTANRKHEEDYENKFDASNASRKSQTNKKTNIPQGVNP